MEKIERNIIPNNKKGKNLIKASTLLDITLEDYVYSRKNNNFEHSNIEKENQTEKIDEDDLVSGMKDKNYNNYVKGKNEMSKQNQVPTNQSKPNTIKNNKDKPNKNEDK